MTTNDWIDLAGAVFFFAFVLLSLKLNRDLKKAEREIAINLANLRDMLATEHRREDQRIKNLLERSRLLKKEDEQ